MRLVLFDIDGTLVTVQGAGRRSTGRALERVYGTSGALDRFDCRFFDGFADTDGAADERLREEAWPHRGLLHVQA